MDYMIPKSKAEEVYLPDLRKIFERLRKYALKLNPNKYVLGAASQITRFYGESTWY